MSMSAAMETRTTAWHPVDQKTLPWKQMGVVAYREWQQTDGRAWWVRREWKFSNNITSFDEWHHDDRHDWIDKNARIQMAPVEATVTIKPSDERMLHEMVGWDWSMVPAEFYEPLRKYVQFGILPEGPLLKAILANDLATALLMREASFAIYVRTMALFMTACLPPECWGSKAKLNEWEQRGGLYRYQRRGAAQ